jgi:UDP-N-acetylmuramoyl-tripeptide--D-alanyl-D-alanine ligase
MIGLSLAELAAVVAGRVVGSDAAAELRITGEAFVDSRTPRAGGLFVAVVGERVDGHDFAGSAVSAGAAAALVERPVGVPAVVVDDAVTALGKLASHVVAALPGLTVVGVTGSQGKTGTKDLLAQLLEPFGATVAPQGSYNNEIGLPLTATRVTTESRYLVCELGARGRGHIHYLASLVRPRVGVVLNVGVAHIGEFGTRDAIAAAKGELVEGLPSDGIAVLNADDPLVAAMRSRTVARVITFGRSAHADVQVRDVMLDECGRPSFTLCSASGTQRIQLPMVGEHQALNAAAAVAVTESLGLPLADVARTLHSVHARSPWRMELTTTDQGVTVVNDAYNANPDSSSAALRTLTEIAARRHPPARSVAVLGEMRELGSIAAAEHQALGRLAAELGVSVLVAVGPVAGDIARAADEQPSWQGRSWSVDDPAAAADLVTSLVRPGDVVLVKASRAAGLESVAAALQEGQPTAARVVP